MGQAAAGTSTGNKIVKNQIQVFQAWREKGFVLIPVKFDQSEQAVSEETHMSLSGNPIIENRVFPPEADSGFFDGLAKLIDYPVHSDERGSLTPFTFDQLPFRPCRTFVVADVPTGAVRGGHAHKYGWQMLVCLQGRIDILMRYRKKEISLVMEPGRFGLVFGPGVWCQQKYLQKGSVLLVFASEPFDPESYIRDCP